jgi:hypothetical protein
MKKYLIITLILVIAATFPITAKQENISLGPYRATFDLNITEPCSIKNLESYNGETYEGTPATTYATGIACGKELTMIVIMHYDLQLDTKNRPDEKSKINFLAKKCNDEVAIYNRKIDGNNGSLCVSSNCVGYEPSKRLFYADYWIDEVNNMGNTHCSIFSSLPWDKGTLSLLKTIHIEETS